ncbi:MAG: type II toxin-antitoxin system Phd/YefM family antitoxin [Actinobacteria bacterium]|jgi:prevent-host-death family protein|nr:type II toxin-antitoxin system Phd/YefM family antitoxin [Actinomycetota bacterium]
MTTLPLSEAEVHLSEIAENVAHTHGRVLITKDGQDYVVLLAAEDLDSIEATLELLRDPEAQRRIEQAESEIARGEFLDEKEVRALVDGHRRMKAG